MHRRAHLLRARFAFTVPKQRARSTLHRLTLDPNSSPRVRSPCPCAPLAPLAPPPDLSTARVVSPPSLPYPRTHHERTACGTRGTTSRHPLSNSFFQVQGTRVPPARCACPPLSASCRVDRSGWLPHILRCIQISVAVCLGGCGAPVLQRR
ncbi:hypothetical protein B0H14DRAFT_266561 [Mycena olivaceomarginata]|nr:hypothetical protein B0H14DRAFT_266561 [Mycena olivaceomarginata]